MSNDAKINLLKRVLRTLAQVNRKFPNVRVIESDIHDLEAWITELGGEARTGTHRAILDGKERKD